MIILIVFGTMVVFIASWFAAFMWGYTSGRVDLADQELADLRGFAAAMREVILGDLGDINLNPDLAEPPAAPTPASPQTRRGFGVSARTRRPGGSS